MVVANASNAAVVLDALVERAAGFDTVVTDKSTDYALIAVQGPRSVEILAGLTDDRPLHGQVLRVLPDHGRRRRRRCSPHRLHGRGRLRALRRPPPTPPPSGRRSSTAGEAHELKPCGLGCRDTLRLEAGMPLYGNELTTALTPYHANLGRVVKLDKPGDFVGRDALPRSRSPVWTRSWSA